MTPSLLASLVSNILVALARVSKFGYIYISSFVSKHYFHYTMIAFSTLEVCAVNSFDFAVLICVLLLLGPSDSTNSVSMNVLLL